MKTSIKSAWYEPAALACADSFLNTAKSLLDSRSIADELPEGRMGYFGQSFGNLAACATNLAFALEIYLKTLRVQHGLPACPQGKGPNRHDLSKMYNDLPAAVRAVMEARFDAARKLQHPAQNAAITFALSPSPKLPPWPDRRSQSTKLGDILERSKDVFVSWRYVFEFEIPDGEAHRMRSFEYLFLFMACEAVNAAILRNWFTPTFPDGTQAWLLLGDEDYAKVSQNQSWTTATITDQYTDKCYRLRKVPSDKPGDIEDVIAEEAPHG
jgi:hypothetical protein